MTSPLRNPSAGALFTAAVVLGPALLLWHLHALWNPDGAYAYGWVVPLLAVYLCKARWDDRPAPSAPVEGAAILAIAFAVITLPSLWLQEAAPERSICRWSYAVASVGVSLSLIWTAGGGAWLRWFSFPLAFVLTSVPWPHTLEVLVTNSLMGVTAGVTVEMLCLFGVPCVQSGHLVHIENGVIDIDEACSGIRSLQAMVMISLFLGELFRSTLARRLALLLFGLAVTLVMNVLRTVALSGIGFGRGMSAVDRYHDAAGFTVLAFSLTSTLLMASKLRCELEPEEIPDAPEIPLSLPLRLSSALLICFLAEEIAVETWYRWREPKWEGWSWAVEWPRQREGFHFIEISKRSLPLLMCDEAHEAGWKEPDGSEWLAYWIRWNPGNAAAEAAKVHRPDVCLNAEGALLEKDMGVHLCSVGGLQLPFHSYAFRMGEKPLYVFFCLYEEIPGARALVSTPEFESVDMLRRALQGRRRIGQQSLELALAGYSSEAAAQAAFQARLGQLMQIRKGARE